MSDTNETASAAPDKSARKPAAGAAKSEEKLMTPEDWARATGTVKSRKRFMTLKGNKPKYEAFPMMHNVAAVMHGWAEHAHHTGKPMLISREDYLKAVEVAGNENNPPHPAALSPHRGKGR